MSRLTYVVTAERQTTYEVAAESREEAIDLMIDGEATETGGTTYKITAVPVCPVPTCEESELIPWDSDGEGWKCPTCGCLYGEET